MKKQLMTFQDEMNNTAHKMGIDPEIIHYGFKAELSFLIDCLIILSICLFLDKFIEGCIFITVFSFLRIFCGGYHCSSYISCGIVYGITVIISCVVLITFPITYNVYFHMLLTLILFLITPVENKNNPLSDSDTIQYRIIARKRIMLVFAIDIILFLFNVVWANSIIGAVMLSISGFCIIQLFINRLEQ